MPAITVRMAETEADFAAARRLCAEWLDWHWQNFPADGPRAGNPLDPVTFQVVIDTLEQIHARPRGAVLLAEVDGQARGCVMYHEAGATTAEFKRLFVNESGRGHGLGRLLLEKMFSGMAEDGYKDVMFSSARFLTHARRLYESAGFRDMASPEGLPDEIARFIYFMEHPLTRRQTSKSRTVQKLRNLLRRHRSRRETGCRQGLRPARQPCLSGCEQARQRALLRTLRLRSHRQDRSVQPPAYHHHDPQAALTGLRARR